MPGRRRPGRSRRARAVLSRSQAQSGIGSSELGGSRSAVVGEPGSIGAQERQAGQRLLDGGEVRRIDVVVEVAQVVVVSHARAHLLPPV